MKTLYLDIFSGISGDMFIGAMLDLGVDAQRLEAELAKLNLPNYHLHSSRQVRGQIAGTKFDVHAAGHHHGSAPHPHIEHGHEHHAHVHAEEGHEPERTFADIQQLISASSLSPWIKEKSLAVFLRIAEVEGKIHGRLPEKVHFHEVGALDSIIDIVGACVALELLGKPRVLSGPIIEGTGTIKCAHGTFPLPAPATLELLSARKTPIQQCDEPHELVTPTGAALLAEFAENFGPMQNLVPTKVGYGLGSRENRTRPNVLRAILGETTTNSTSDWESDSATLIETNLDDINPEILGAFVDKALATGALDIFYTPIQMKKNRPGVILSLLCAPEQADQLTRLVLQETSAFGVRRTTMERRKLQREFTKVQTPYGEVTVKIGRLNGEVVQVAPEFESCKAIAEKTKAPLNAIYKAALKAFNT